MMSPPNSDLAFAVTGDSIGAVWEESVRRLLEVEGWATVDSDVGGPSIELPVVTLRAQSPQLEPRVSDVFVDPDLVRSYEAILQRPSSRVPGEMRTLADRIYAYPIANGRRLDQFRRCINELRRNPLSRRAIIQLWDPAQDLGSSGLFSSSHCFLQLTVREGLVNMTAVSRSVDAWLGALPNMLGFFALQEKAAQRLDFRVGWYCHVIGSYHIYLRDIPAAAAALER